MRTHILSLFLLMIITACAPAIAAQAPTATVTPAVTPTECGCSSIYGPDGPTPTAAFVPAGPKLQSTPADLESLRDQWTTYRNEAYGFSFEYPAVYQEGDYGFCAPREQSDSGALQGALFLLNIGSRTTLTLLNAEGKTLQTAAEEFRADPTRKDAQFDPPQERTVAGQLALTLPYRSGGTNRYAEATLWVKDGALYVLETGTPSACDVAEIDLKELTAYQKLIESFQ